MTLVQCVAQINFTSHFFEATIVSMAESKYRILLAIADSALRNTINSSLRIQGFEVVTVDQGSMSLSKLEEDDNFGCVVIIDHFEDMPSQEVLGLIRINWPKEKLHVILMSSEPTVDEKKTCLELGATSYLIRTDSPVNLFEKLDRLSQGKR